MGGEGRCGCGEGSGGKGREGAREEEKLEGRGGLGKRGELKCYIHTDIHTYRHTYRPSDEAGFEELLLLKSKSVNVKEGIFVYL